MKGSITKHLPFFLLCGIFFLDQLSKFIAVHWTFSKNTGTLFGLFPGSNAILIWLSLVAIGAILYFFPDVGQKERIALAAILAGILGNLVDRIARGYVIDFIDLKVWPAFNFADISITVGCCLLFLFLIKRD